MLLAQDLMALPSNEREAYGISSVMCAQRVANVKFMNVTLGSEA
jgi:hypothetical protein